MDDCPHHQCPRPCPWCRIMELEAVNRTLLDRIVVLEDHLDELRAGKENQP